MAPSKPQVPQKCRLTQWIHNLLNEYIFCLIKSSNTRLRPDLNSNMKVSVYFSFISYSIALGVWNSLFLAFSHPWKTDFKRYYCKIPFFGFVLISILNDINSATPASLLFVYTLVSCRALEGDRIALTFNFQPYYVWAKFFNTSTFAPRFLDIMMSDEDFFSVFRQTNRSPLCIHLPFW